MTAASAVDSAAIGVVWQMLGGGPIKAHRARAFWRNGDGWNVALDDAKGTWYDHARGEGGGVLDLIATVRGCSRSEALQWLAAQSGATLDDAPAKRRIVAEYSYTDEHGELLYQVVRYDPKEFRQRRPDGRGGWIWNMRGIRRALYRKPEVIESPIVFLTEGEKDAEVLREHGFVATTNVGGAKAEWLPEYTDTLRGREVIVIPDRDAPGRKRAAAIVRALWGNVARLIVLDLEHNGKDVADWFAAGHSELELISLVEGEGVTR